MNFESLVNHANINDMLGLEIWRSATAKFTTPKLADTIRRIRKARFGTRCVPNS